MLDLPTTEHLLLLFAKYPIFSIGFMAASFMLFIVIGAKCLRSLGGLTEKIAKSVQTASALIFIVVGSGQLLLSVTYWVLQLNKTYLSGPTDLIALMSHPINIPLALFTGYTLYRLRQVRPALYGTIELLVAIFSIQSAVLIQTRDLATKIFAFFGGIYILVRALDNINKGVPTVLEPFWSKFFGPSERALARGAKQ